MKKKPIILWITWGTVTVLATVCELLDFNNNSTLQIVLKSIGLLLFLICGIIFIISIISTIHFFSNCEKLEPARLEGMHCVLNLIRKKEYIERNKKVYIENMVKNCYYTNNAATSHVTYIITCQSKLICNKLYFPVGGGTDLDNIHNINYYFIEDRNNFLDDNTFWKCENFESISKFRIDYKRNGNLLKALIIELPFSKSMKKGELFQIVVTYTLENCMLPKCDGTSYISDMFPSGIKTLNTNLMYPNTIFISEVGIYKLLFNSHKILIDSPNMKKNDEYTLISWTKENPKGTYLIERAYQSRCKEVENT